MEPNQVLTIIFRKKKEDYEFLLLRRTPELGGFWQPPAGGVESTDESLLEAAYREVYEESGITKKNVIRIFEKIYFYVFDRHYLTDEPVSKRKQMVYAFEVKPDVKISLESNVNIEHDDFKWVSYDEALDMLKWDDNKESCRKLHSLIF